MENELQIAEESDASWNFSGRFEGFDKGDSGCEPENYDTDADFDEATR